MRELKLDIHGQPANPRVNFAHRLDRGIHEMLGLCRGILSDGLVVDKEATYLSDWIAANSELAITWPIDVLTRRLRKIFDDGVVDEDERNDLAQLLGEIAGGKVGVMADGFAPTTLPIDKPPPDLVFKGQTFVFTGRFALGPRQICEDITHQRGAFCESRVTKRTNYLIIGTFGSTHWAHSSFGRKILSAVDRREKGGFLKIVAEDHWAEAIH